MDKSLKIYIAGHQGLVGSAIYRKLKDLGFQNFVLRSSNELDLTKQQVVEDFFSKEKPDYVFLAAAKVGGILANSVYRGQFIYENLMIQNNVIHTSYLHGVKKLLFLGSSCIYPKNASQPIQEESLLTGVLESTNESYAIAKIAGLKMCESYYKQYGCNFISVMPTNLYGPNDNYNLDKSHVLPALIRKMHLAHCLETGDIDALRKDICKWPIAGISGNATETEILNVLEKYGIRLIGNSEGSISTSVTLWGTGTPLREFLHVDDMADACIYLMKNVDMTDFQSMSGNFSFLNIGCGEELSIRDLAETVKRITRYQGKILWDNSYPDGTLRKLLDVTRLHTLGWSRKIGLEDGILSVYKAYCQR